MEHESALPSGFRFDEYEIVRVLGAGGFGITYLGYDLHLDIPIAIKEYLPNDLAVRKGDTSVVAKSSGDQPDFDWGLERFLDEARLLARFDHPNLSRRDRAPNLPRVYRYFQAHGTGYIVMEYIEGTTLSELFKRKGKLTEAELKAIVLPLLEGLEKVHEAGYLHRDIKPANIVLREDGSPVLIDFGAARAALGAKTRSISAIVADGYSPIEQYATTSKQGDWTEQGAWTDLYALGSVMYRALTGATPEMATVRVKNDPLRPVAEVASQQASPTFLRCIDWAIAVYREDRPQTIGAWRAAMEEEGTPATAAATAAGPAAPAARSAGAKKDSPWSAGLAIAAVVIVAITVGQLLWEPPAEPDVQTEPPDAVPSEPQRDPPPEEEEISEGEDAPAPEATTETPDVEHDAWRQAARTDTPQAYRQYLEDYPDGSYANLAAVKLESLERDLWVEANRENTREAYEEFARLFPGSRLAGLAKVKAENL